MFKTKAELIADLVAKNASKEEIAEIKNTTSEDLVSTGLIEGKTKDVASKGVNVASENTTPKNTDSDSESTSSALETPVDTTPTIEDSNYLGSYVRYSGEKPEEVKKDPYEPQLVVDIGGETLTLDEVTRLAGETPVGTYIKENDGIVGHDKEHILPEIRITPAYKETIKRADELFENEVGEILSKVHEGTSVSQLNIQKKTNEFGGDVEISEDDEYLLGHVKNPLTGLEDVKDGYNIVGVRRTNTNLKGNQSLTSIELKSAATKIWDQLKAEDSYIGGYEEDGFNFKTQQKTKKELNDWALEYQTKVDWTDPLAMYNFAKAYESKMEEVWIREAELDEDYQFRANMIEDIMHDKFRGMIINKGIEEERSDLIPDNWENAGTLPSAIYEFAKYVIPSSLSNDRVAINGQNIYSISENLKQGESKGWTDKTKGFIGNVKGRLQFREAKGYNVTGMKHVKATTWGEAKITLNTEIDKYGYIVMENLAKSREYQEKLSLLGSPELLDENWNWNLDAEGYKKLLGTQLGQMALGTLSFGGSTFMQELGQMSQQLILEKSVMMMEGIPMDGSIANFSEKEVEHLMKKFGKLSVEEQNYLAMQVLKGGHIPFDELYTSAARSGGLDLIGNWFVIGKGAKLVPKQLVTGFMTKNLNMFFKGAGSLLATVGTGTLGEMLTEGLQATNSERTVSINSPLSTFDYHPVVNEAMMAAVVPGPVIIAGQSVQMMVQSIKDSNLDTSKGSYEAWFTTAKNKIDASNLSQQEKTESYERLWNAQEILSSTNLKDVKGSEQRQNIINQLLESQEHNAKINELQAEIEKRKKDVGESAKTTDIDKEIALLQEKVSRNIDIMVQEKTIDSFVTNAERQAEWQNRQSEGLNKNRFTKIFKTKDEAKKYLLKNYPEQYSKFKNMLEGGYGANVQMIGPDGEVIAYNFAIEEHVIAGIKNGDLTAGNVINHEQAHDNLSTFSTEELKALRLNVLEEMEVSKDPQLQRALILMRAKLKGYADKKGTRTEHEEFFTAMSDAFHYLNMENLSIDGSTTLSLMGETFSDAFGRNIGPIVDWKTGFSEMGVVDFIKSYTKESRVEETIDPIADLRDGKEPGLFDEDVKKGSDGIYVQDSRRVYPTGRTNDEIKQANKVLADLIQDQIANPPFSAETNPNWEVINAGEMKKLEGELVANNMGLINMFLKHKSNGGLYFDPKAGDVNYSDFSEAVMGAVGDIINTYTPYNKDTGKYQEFSSYLGALMDRRIPGIWDGLVNKMEFTPDPDFRQDEAGSDYDDFMNDFENEIITIGGVDTTIKEVTSKMRKTFGIKDNDPLYNEILDDVIEITIQNWDAINEEGFLLDTQDRIKERLFKKIKNKLGSPKSEKYITWLNDNIEEIYNLLPQSVFNKSYDQFNDIVSERANVAQSEDKDVEFEKGVKIKSKTAGNRVAVKKPFTPEIGEQFIQNLLNPEKGRAASKQDGLVDQLSTVIGLDAVSTAIESKAFQDTHGSQQAIMGVIADKINRDMTVQFSNETTGIKYELKNHDDLSKANQLIGSVERSGLIDHNEIEDWVRTQGKKLGMKQDVIEFVVHLDSKEIIEVGDAIKFKSDIIKYLEIKDPDLAASLKADGAIKGKKAVLDKIAEDITTFTGGLDPEILDAVGFDILAFHRRALNAGETQHGPKRGDGSTVQKMNAKNPKGNQSYANKNTTLLLDGWTFNPYTNMFVHNKGKHKPSEDPVKEYNATTTSAPYFQTLENIKATNELKKSDPNYSPTGKYDGVRIMNIDYPGGLFKKIGNILNDKTITSRQARIDKIIKLHGPEIEAANRANTELATDISIKLIQAVKDGSMDPKTLIHVLQSQTNLAFGFRGLTKLSMISVSEGAYKDDGSRVYGEHINPNSSKMLELAKIALRAKKDGGYNYREAVAKLFSDHEQVLFPSSDAKTIDTSKLLSGPTSTGSYDRLKALTPKQRANFVGINGESYKEALANANAKKNIEIETAKKKFESEREELKAEAIKKINQKTIGGEIQGTTVMDFDLTVGESSNVVVATNPKTGKTRNLDGVDWAKYGDKLLKDGWTMDFSDFNKVTDGRPGPLLQKLKNQIKKYGVDNVHILTARAAESAPAIHAWLQSQGINLPLENIVGLGNSTGQAKADWIENNLILNGFNDIYFVDDHHENVEAVQNMFNEYPPGVLVDGGKSVIVEAAKANTDNKVIFMVGGAGSGKSTIINKAKLSENYTILNPDAKMEADLKAAGLSLDRSIYEKGSPELSQWAKIQSAAVKDFKNKIIEARESGIGVIIDGTGASKKVMQAYYDAFAAAGYSIGAIGVQTSLETAQHRNTQRERVLHEKIVSGNWESVQANIELYKEMFGDNFFEVFTDDMLMDDALPSDFVRDVSSFTTQNPLEFDKGNVKFSLSTTFNKILEDTEGMQAEKVFSKAQGQIRGKNAGGLLDAIYPASAYDFEMFTYKYMGEGEVGEQQALFFKEKLFVPYEQATQQIDQQKQAVREDYKALVKELPKVRKNLKKNIEGTNYTVEQAVRVYTWTKNGIEIPGLSKRDHKALIKAVEADPELIMFSDRLSAISRQKEGYVAPSEYWTVEGISYDLTEMTGKVGRAKALAGWKQNVEEIFSEENKNKLRALYGNDHVEALEDMLYRMEYGRNKGGTGRIEQNWNNWVNNSVGAVMFFNMRSAALQTISAFNYINWENNSVGNAALAFANQPQYWKDFGTIFNSDYLKERRSGNKRTINEAELSNHLKGSTNKAKAALAWLLEKGFTPTQIADSFAIASGGASYYRNQIKAYEKQGMSTKDAETQAWMDFRDQTEKGQQSSRPDLISQQQAGGLGRLILAFKNTPMQYNRKMIKAIADLKNGRGDTKTNLGKIAYYGAVQNAIFTSLQTALFSALGDEDEWDTKKERMANGMIDSILNGMGLTGAVAVTIKNGYLEYSKQKEKGFNADHTRTILEFANLSPTIGSKLRKLYGGIRTEQINEGAIEEMGFNINNPAFNSLANVISATTNIPLDRAVNKIQNILLASKSETEAADKIALVLGWNPWDLNLETESRKVNVEVKEKKKEEKKVQKKIEKEEKKKEVEKTNIEKQKQEKKEGKEVGCAKQTNSGRCGLPIVKGNKYCTVHQEVEQRKDGKIVQCKKIKKNKERCGVMTSNKSGYCYYHD